MGPLALEGDYDPLFPYFFVGEATLFLGGGDAALNAATNVILKTGTTVSSQNGTEAIRWDNTQRYSITHED